MPQKNIFKNNKGYPPAVIVQDRLRECWNSEIDTVPGIYCHLWRCHFCAFGLAFSNIFAKRALFG